MDARIIDGELVLGGPFVCRGYYKNPEETEGIFYGYPEIREILVREDGDVIGAVIYPEYSEGCSDEEKEAVNERVRAIVTEYNHSAVNYKRVNKVEISAEPLEKTATNKIKRY